jgi:hypothetical protein
MPAVFDVYLDSAGSDNAPGTLVAITNLRLRTDDANTVDNTNPVPIVATLTKYSYWRQVYMKCTTAPSVLVNNVKMYTDGGGFGAGIVTYIGGQFPVKNSGSSSGYDVATGTVGDTGDRMDSGANKHTDITTRNDLFGYTLGSPMTGPSISEASSQIDAINETTNYAVLQVEVVDTASSGVKTAETITFQFDEI